MDSTPPLSPHHRRVVQRDRAHERPAPYPLLVCGNGANATTITKTLRYSFFGNRPGGRLSRPAPAVLRRGRPDFEPDARAMSPGMGADHGKRCDVATRRWAASYRRCLGPARFQRLIAHHG